MFYYMYIYIYIYHTHCIGYLPLYISKYATGFTAIRYINCNGRVMNCCYYNKIIYCLLSNKTGLINTSKLFGRLTPPPHSTDYAFILRINGATLGVHNNIIHNII